MSCIWRQVIRFRKFFCPPARMRNKAKIRFSDPELIYNIGKAFLGILSISRNAFPFFLFFFHAAICNPHLLPAHNQTTAL
jgi:hypothetical protein